MPQLDRDGDVVVLDLGDGETRFHPDWVAGVDALLDEVTAMDGVALVTTARGKVWSNGLDQAWMAANPDSFAPYIEQVNQLLARVLTFPHPTFAAIGGHAFAAGAMLALCHDVRTMREDRGWWCLPEVDMGVAFGPMGPLIQAKLSPAAANRAMTTGHRFTGPDALAAGIVDELAAHERILAATVARARTVTGKPRGAVGTIKEQMYAAPAAALRAPVDAAGPPDGLLGR